MPCVACAQDPDTHSFEELGQNRQGHIFYTSYKSIKDHTNAAAISAHIVERLDCISGGPWIWMIDCKFVQAKHMVQIGVAIKLLEMLRFKYGDSLMAIYLINSGTVIQTAISALSPFITKEFSEKIYKIQGTPLELLMLLTKQYGWTQADADPIIRRTIKDYA
jgi:hypothetical protein